jgi:hypothetical protein
MELETDPKGAVSLAKGPIASRSALQAAGRHLGPFKQATNHGWVNHGTQPCRILFVLMDSREP